MPSNGKVTYPDWDTVSRDQICNRYRTVLPKIQGEPLRTKNKNWFVKQRAWLFDRRFWRTTDYWYYEFVRSANIKGGYIPAGTVFMIPVNFYTDFASSPGIFWPVGMRPTGILLVPSILHDCGYRHDFYLNQYGEKIYEGRGKKFHDALFRYVCEEVNDMKTPGYLAYVALDLFGWLAWWNSTKNHNGEIDLVGNYKR